MLTLRRSSVAAAVATALLVGSQVPAATAQDNEPTELVDRLLLNPGADAGTSMAVTFRANTDGATVDYRQSGTEAVESVIAESKGSTDQGVHQSVRLTDLEPGTSYDYRVVSEGESGPWHTFTTSTAGPQQMLFFGDAQNGLDNEWQATTAAARAAMPDPDLILQSGDMININTDDSEWGNWYEGLAPELVDTPLLTAIGNHELTPDLTGRPYHHHVTNPQNGPTALSNTSYYVDQGGVRYVVLTANMLLLNQQAEFLDAALADNPNDWSVVMFHQPVYNSSTNRDDGINERFFGEVLERHGVDLVLNGHDHAYARGEKSEDGPVYLVATAGSKFYPTSAQNPAWDNRGANRVTWAQDLSTYQTLTLDGCSMSVQSVVTVVGEDPQSSNGARAVGDVLDDFTIDKCGETKVVN